MGVISLFEDLQAANNANKINIGAKCFIVLLFVDAKVIKNVDLLIC